MSKEPGALHGQISVDPSATKKYIIQIDERAARCAAFINLKIKLIPERLAEQPSNFSLAVPPLLNVEQMGRPPEIARFISHKSIVPDLLAKKSTHICFREVCLLEDMVYLVQQR